MQQVVQSIDESDGNCWDCTFSVKWQKMARLKQQKMPKALKKRSAFFLCFHDNASKLCDVLSLKTF